MGVRLFFVGLFVLIWLGWFWFVFLRLELASFPLAQGS